ncbi:hypothetical protein AYO44_00375 [Planctomycetaceae bacterium SCGC AG-212-F19]|nr:hypothetical protein AYO44_00375 [Planctomycetaceae bacterium SCGC AG-212-F19]
MVVYETDGRLAQLLREPVRACRWALREPRQRDVCLRLLRGSDPLVFVLKLGSKLDQELLLLERAHTQAREARSVVVGDLQNEPLANLAWDLGASFVLFPPMPHDWLPEIVIQLMRSAIGSRKQDGLDLEEPALDEALAKMSPQRPSPSGH